MRECDINQAELEEGSGSVIIADSSLLIRPAVAGQYMHFGVKHDTRRVDEIFSLGRGIVDFDQFQWHIITSQTVDQARLMLNPVVHAYVDASRFMIEGEAMVRYVIGDQLDHRSEFGWDDGYFLMLFNIHCEVPDSQRESLIARLAKQNHDMGHPSLVVRPDSSDQGYVVRQVQLD